MSYYDVLEAANKDNEITRRLSWFAATAIEAQRQEGPEGFKGGLSAGNYATITGTSPATTTRDLADLVSKGALVRAGERRHARYQLTIPRRPVTPVTF